MLNAKMLILLSSTLLVICGGIHSCADASANKSLLNEISENTYDLEKERTVSSETKRLWFDGKAELSSYKLTQARYGETHEGTAVLVYVTEPFSTTANTKADHDHPGNISILKLNKTLKFNTGIYPYSMMNSTFFPLEYGTASLKLSSSVQEWCGMTYLEMKNADKFVFEFDSYFEGFTYKNKTLDKTILEDDLWSLIRLNPELLPIGNQLVIPSMFFLRLRNKMPEAYEATLSLEKDSQGMSNYTLVYPALERVITISFNTGFPHEILGWEDTHYSGYGDEKKKLTSKAERLKTIRTDYWNQNHNEDSGWRGKLDL